MKTLLIKARNVIKPYDYTSYWVRMFEDQSPHLKEAQILIDFLKQFEFKTILELGSGQGHLSKQLQKNFECHLTGLDLVSSNQYLDAFINTNVYGFKPETPYDLIVCRNFLMHIKPKHIDSVLFTLIRKSKHFVAVEYLPEIKPIILANHNFIHNYTGLNQKRINPERVILYV